VKLSQVFLTDRRFVDRVVERVEPKEGDVFVEVGPGLGVITFPLMEAGAKVVAIELDTFLCMSLRRKGVDVVCGDYLKTDVHRLLKERGYDGRVRFFSSVPYHITHDLLLKVFGERSLYRDIHLILQMEVARRLVAPPGGKDYGPFSVLAQSLFDASLILNIPNRAFSPVPKVHSSMIRLIPRPDRLNVDAVKFLKFLKGPFGRRRKKLRNTLRGVPKEFEDLRPENLPPETWFKLFSESRRTPNP